jgi:hypothetical protein
MTNDERMTKSESRNSNQGVILPVFALWLSSLGIWNCFVIRHSSFVIRLSIATVILLTQRLPAATNSGLDEIPPLRPPLSELPPSFWEQHGTLLIVLGLVTVALIGVAVWFLGRARPKAPVPPEVRARMALEPLRAQPEDGVILSQVSQILRRYITAAFDLPHGELTTTEFCKVIAGNDAVGPQLSSSISEFLRLCDRRKFAPFPAEQALDGVSKALKFIEAAEARRAELRQAQQAAEAVKS